MARLKSIGSGKPDITEIAAAIVTINREITEVRTEVKAQRSENSGVIIGSVVAVSVAVILIVGTVAVQTMQANTLRGDEFQSEFTLSDKMNAQQIQINNLENVVDNIKVRNPYLK